MTPLVDVDIKLTEEQFKRLTQLQEKLQLESVEETIKRLLFLPDEVDNKFDLAVRIIMLLDPTVVINTPSRDETAFRYRCIITEYLRNSGYTFVKIGELLNRHHASVIYYYNTIRDAVRYPTINKKLISLRKVFYEKLTEISNLNQQ